MLRTLANRIIPTAGLCAALVMLLAACGSSYTSPSSASTPSSPPSPSPSPSPTSTAAGATVVVSTRVVNGLGPILVNGQGLTLYMFVPDNDTKVTCTASCAQVWPPLKLGTGEQAMAEGQAQASLLGSDPDPDGGRVVTYSGWPLYTYVADTAPGSVSGQALNLNGGLWYVLSPSGSVIKTKPS